MDVITALESTIANVGIPAATLPSQGTAEQKRLSKDDERTPDEHTIEQLDVSEQIDVSEHTNVRSKLRIYTILIALCVRTPELVLSEYQLANETSPAHTLRSSLGSDDRLYSCALTRR